VRLSQNQDALHGVSLAPQYSVWQAGGESAALQRAPLGQSVSLTQAVASLQLDVALPPPVTGGFGGATHRPCSQRSVLPQRWQTPPSRPQADDSRPVRQLAASSQHPVLQLATSHGARPGQAESPTSATVAISPQNRIGRNLVEPKALRWANSRAAVRIEHPGP